VDFPSHHVNIDGQISEISTSESGTRALQKKKKKQEIFRPLLLRVNWTVNQDLITNPGKPPPATGLNPFYKTNGGGGEAGKKPEMSDK